MFWKQKGIYEWMLDAINSNTTKEEISKQIVAKISEIMSKIKRLNKESISRLINLKTELAVYEQFCNDFGIEDAIALNWLDPEIKLDEQTNEMLHEVMPNEMVLEKRRQQYQMVIG